MGRKTVARRRFLTKTIDPLTPSATPTPPPSPPQPSPPPSPPPPPPQPSPPPSSPKPPPYTKRRFKTLASKRPPTKPPQNNPPVSETSVPQPHPRRSTRKTSTPSAATTSATPPPRKRRGSPAAKTDIPSSSKRPRVSASDKTPRVLSGRIFPKKWFGNSAFKFFLESLQSQGWVSLVAFNEAVYEDEICQFYKNLSISDDLLLSTTVNEISITLSVDNLAEILGIPAAGFSDLPHQNWPFVSGVDNATISRTISDQPLPHAQIFPTTMLSAKNKLLRNFITKNVLPRIENRGECLIMDQVLMWLLTQGTPISLPHLMFRHMKNLSITPLYYPYGRWLTKIFHAFDVLTPDSKGIPCRDVMNDGILSRMDLCVLKGELFKKDFLGFQPREACEGCLKMMEYMRDMQRQMQQLLARQRAGDTLAAQRHRQIMSKP